MPSSFPVVVRHWLLGQQVLFNRTRMECFLSLAIWSTDLPHICYSSKVRGTCRSCIVMEARAWITLSTMRASKNTRYLSINIWLSWLTFVLIILVLPQEGDTVAVMIAAPFARIRQRTRTPRGWENFPPKYTPLPSCCSPAQKKQSINPHSDFSFSTVNIYFSVYCYVSLFLN